MKSFTSILTVAMATAASAVDLRLAYDCKGGWSAACTKMNPNACCMYGNQPYTHAYPIGLQPGWQVSLSLNRGGNCDQSVWFAAPCLNNQCLSNPTWAVQSVKYYFIGKKARGVEVSEEKASSECQAPDQIVSPDGTSYSIDHLNEGELDAVHEHMKNGTAEFAVEQFGLVAKV